MHKNFLLFRNLGDLEDPNTGAIPTVPGSPNAREANTTFRSTLTDEQETHGNQVYAVGGRDRFGGVVVDYHAAYSRATFDVGRNINATFVGPSALVSYDNITDSNNIPILKILDGTNVNNAALYHLTSVNDSREHDIDEEYTYAGNLLVPFHLVGDDKFKFGIQARLRDKQVNPFNVNYAVPAGISELGLSTAPNLDYYGGGFSNGPFIDRYGIRKLIFSGVVTGPGTIPFSQDRSYSATENVYAGYGQYTTQIGKFGLLAGVRVETIDGQYGGYVHKFDAMGGTISDNFQSRYDTYTDVFPTVELRYNFTPSLIGRVSWTTGIARPGFNQNNNTASVTVDTPVLISRGNPALKPTLADNFDIDLEYYLRGGGVVQLGFFDKEITNYIITRTAFNVFNDPLSPGVQATVTGYSSIPFAFVRGIEAAYDQRFTFLPGFLRDFGFDANAVYNNSQIQEYSADETNNHMAQYGLLPGTSRFTANAAIFYESKAVKVRVSTQYVSHSLFSLSNNDKSFDTIQDDRLTLDFNSSYQITPDLQAYFQARNLTDEPLRYYEGSSNKQIQREFYDVTLEGGIKAHF